MIISGKQVQNVLKLYGQQTEVKKGAPKKEAKQTPSHLRPDSVDFSSQAKEMMSALNSTSGQEEVRMDRVNQLREKIESGQYQVDPEQVAEKMIQRIITDRLV